jgi:hypothetical protein
MFRRIPDLWPKVNLTSNARVVLEKRYLRKVDGEVAETPEDMLYRVATVVAEVDKKYGYDENDIRKLTKEFYEMMVNLEFMPNSPTLMNAGRDLGQLSACYVLPVGDSMEEIFDAIKNAAIIHKSGGGTGFSFSKLRPKNSTVRSSHDQRKVRRDISARHQVFQKITHGINADEFIPLGLGMLEILCEHGPRDFCRRCQSEAYDVGSKISTVGNLVARSTVLSCS